MVTHGVDGLLVPPRDKEGLARALISLLRDQSLRQEMGAKGRAKALEHSWEQIARKVFDYYVRVLGEPPWRKQFSQSKATTISV